MPTDPGKGISGAGTTLSGVELGVLAMIQKISIEGHEADEIDVSTMLAPGMWKIIIAGMKDAKSVNLELIYYKSQQQQMIDAFGVDDIFTILLPDGSSFVNAGHLKKIGTAIPFNDKISQAVTLRLSGPPTFNEAS